MSEPRLTHTLICDVLGIERSHRRPDWKPYAKQLTKVEIFAEGERVQVFGGGFGCACCGYSIDIQPPGDTCPRCGYNGVDYATLPLAASSP